MKLNEKILTAIVIASLAMCISSLANADDYDPGERLLSQMQKELKTDRVASRQDKRLNRSKVTLAVRWDIGSEFEIQSRAKFSIDYKHRPTVTFDEEWKPNATF